MSDQTGFQKTLKPYTIIEKNYTESNEIILKSTHEQKAIRIRDL